MLTQPPEDEWFAPAEESRSSGTPREPVEDQWLVESPAARPPASDRWTLTNPPFLALIGLAVVFLVALLAAFGAFGSDAPAPGVPILTAAPPSTRTSAAPTTTTAAPRSSAVAPTTTLKPGDSGPQVKLLQRELAALGFAVGTIDGSYGPGTSKAVAAFQRAHHLTADGVVGPATLLALAP